MNPKKKILKIAQIAPISERVPPKKYGGTERIIYALTQQLVKMGHKVTLFATGDSKTSAKLASVYPKSLREAVVRDPYGLNEWVLYHIANAYKKQDKFDIIHDHNSIYGLPAAEFAKTPVVVTIHGAITLNNRQFFAAMKNPNFVTISKAQTKFASGVKPIGMVYNGLPMQSYPFGAKHKSYMLFVGRISMEKGVHFAIDASTFLNTPLIIAAKLDEIEKDYYTKYIEPRLFNEQVKWIGEVDEKARNELMAGAMCILHPVTWREPFGLTMIEAMACGCPVVAFNRGSIPEVVLNKKTGYVVNDLEEMIIAIRKIGRIDRRFCRKYALEKFNDKLMAQNYEKIYYQILAKNPPGPK